MTLVSKTMFVRSMIIDSSTEVPHDSAEGEIPAEKVMTSGCGLVNGSALLKITQHQGVHEPRSALKVKQQDIEYV